MKSIFAQHGIPEIVISDNGPQFASKEFAEFAAKWEFSHITSSPRYPKANGMAEQTVQTIKKLLEKSDKNIEDPYLAILAHRSCPDPNGDPSPAEKLMNRQLRTRLPAVRPVNNKETLTPMRNMQKKQNQAFYHDRNAKELPKLDEGSSTVRVYQHGSPSTKANWSTKAKVVKPHHSPRSYIIKTEEGQTLRRNRRDLLPTSEHPDGEEPQGLIDVPNTLEESLNSGGNEVSDEDTAPASYTTRYGRVVKPPTYFH